MQQEVQKRKDNLVGATIAGLVFVGIILFALLYPVFLRAREPWLNAACMNSVKEMAIAVDLYTNDYDNHLPQSSRWCDLVYEYVKNKDAYQCPMARELKCGYAMNSNLKSTPVDYRVAAEKVMLFESDRGWNAHGGAEAMLSKPRHSIYSVAFSDTHMSPVSEERKKQLQW